MFKLTVTWDLGEEQENANGWAKEVMDFIRTRCHTINGRIAEVSLTRHGDRSGANLLAPIPNSKHFKNHKIPIIETK